MGTLFSLFTTDVDENQPRARLPQLAGWEQHQVVQAIVESMELAEVSLEKVKSQQKAKSRQKRDDSKWIERFGGDLELVDTGAGGDCQFKSLSYCLFGTPKHHKLLRQQIAAEIREHQNDFEAAKYDVLRQKPYDSLEDYCSALESTNLWGSHATLQACSNICDINIQVLSSLSGGSRFPLIRPRQNANCDRTIHLAHISELHYLAIKPKPIKSNQRGGKRRNSSTSETKPRKRTRKSTRYHFHSF